MSKRPASAGFSCSGCSANFDTETHVPFVGSCGDSICSVCLDEKKITNCPECNLEGAFAWNQKNSLAIKLLSAAVEKEASDSKKVKLDVGEDAPEEPVPAILDPKNLPFLAQIVNQLNPISFLNLASTCKTLHNYCFNCKDVKIIYEIDSITVTEKRDRPGVERFFYDIRQWTECFLDSDDDYQQVFVPLDYTGYRRGFLSSAIGRTKLRNYPFEFRLKELVFREINRFDDAFFTPLRKLIAEFPIKTVTSISTSEDSDWKFPQLSEGFLQFLKDFRIMTVDFTGTKFAEDVSDEALNYLLQNTENIPERWLLNASVPDLFLSTSISETTFVDLIKKFVDSTDEISWMLGCNFELIHDALRSFNILPFDYKGPLPDEHPIIFVKHDEPQECWLLRKDGKVLHCHTYEGMDFSMCSPPDYPPCVRRDVENESSDGDSDDESESEDGSGDESND